MILDGPGKALPSCCITQIWIEGWTVESTRPTVAHLLNDLTILRSAISGATWFPPNDPTDPTDPGYFEKEVHYSVELIAASHNLGTLCDALELPSESRSLLYWKSAAADGIQSEYNSGFHGYGRDCGSEEGDNQTLDALAVIERKLNAMHMLGCEYPTREIAEASHIPHQQNGLEDLTAKIAGRLNEHDRETLQALVELNTSGEVPATVAIIARRSGRPEQATKQLTGAMHRFGILDRGANGAGYCLSKLGARVAAKVFDTGCMEVATKGGTEVGTD